MLKDILVLDKVTRDKFLVDFDTFFLKTIGNDDQLRIIKDIIDEYTKYVVSHKVISSEEEFDSYTNPKKDMGFKN
jgi:hypothetical protein